jgi:hypothetical protein
VSNNPFRYFKTSPEIIQLGVLIYVRFPVFLRNLEGLLQRTRERLFVVNAVSNRVLLYDRVTLAG